MKKIAISLIFVIMAASLSNAQNAWINEIHYDNIGIDTAEMVEVVIECAGRYNLSSFSLILYNGSNGAPYNTTTLDFFIAGATVGNFSIYYYIYPQNGIQNGSPDGLALAHDGILIPEQFLSYEGTFTGVGGPAEGILSLDIGVTEDNFTPVGFSLQLSGTGSQYANFSWQAPATATSGTSNNNQVFDTVGGSGGSSQGNIGIGVTSPEQKLQVYGKIAAAFGSTNSASYVFDDGSENTGLSSPGTKTVSVINNGAETARFTSSGQMAVGTNNPATSAIVEVASSEKGILIPRMTTNERDSIGNPAEGLMIYNTTESKFNYYTDDNWKAVVSTTSSSGSSAEGAGYCSEGVTDYDGHYYKTVKIGDQCWMAENLKSTHYANGSLIPWKYAYNNEQHNSYAYGRLYTWNAFMHDSAASNSNPSGVQGVCPNGWHVPSDPEWQELEMTLGMSATDAANGGDRGTHGEGTKLKETDDAHFWQTGTSPGNNASGFSAIPGGWRNNLGTFAGLESYAYFWTTSESSSTIKIDRELYYNSSTISKGNVQYQDAFSARCVRD
jgi:uncharacterized protein (TIGR02145 family)